MLFVAAATKANSATIVAVAAGHTHSLYLTSDGKLYAMGSNSSGQLGDGTTTNRAKPVQVAASVTSVAARGNHSLYVTNDGRLFTMGDNQYAQLGDGTTNNKTTPVHVASDVSIATTGGTHFLYATNDGKLHAAELNNYNWATARAAIRSGGWPNPCNWPPTSPPSLPATIIIYIPAVRL